MEILTVLWRESLFFKRRFIKITSSAIISPLLYLIAFGWGLGENVVVEGHNYMYFIIPGIIALSTMNTSFNAVTIRIIVSRMHEKSFEYYFTSPVNMIYLAFGQVLAGAMRGMYNAILIILLSYIFKIYITINFIFIVICFLNCLTFAAFGYFAALVINSHYDMNRFSAFIITPMSFLCGTFFSLKKMPIIIKSIINILPLTHASESLRAISLNNSFNYISIIVLLLYFAIFLISGIIVSFREFN